MRILLTGGAGYIGSHTAVELIQAGHEVIIADNLSNSSIKAVRRVERLTNSSLGFYEVDLLDQVKFENVFQQENIDAVIHLAGFKAVGESVSQPIAYYQNNLISTLNLCQLMQKYAIKKLVFSSSATIYGTT